MYGCAYVSVCTYVCMCVCMSVCMCVCLRCYIYIYIYIYISVCARACAYIYIYIYIYIYMCVCVCVCVSVIRVSNSSHAVFTKRISILSDVVIKMINNLCGSRKPILTLYTKIRGCHIKVKVEQNEHLYKTKLD